MIRIASTIRSSRRQTLGPQDHGRVLTLDEYENTRETPGFIYEIIDGVLNVSPMPAPPHDHWVVLVGRRLEKYSELRPDRINYVSRGAEIVVNRRLGPTRPIPDVAAYQDFPDPPPRKWDNVAPLIVVEVISKRRFSKDTDRNRHLYWLVKSIGEYWIVDPTEDPVRPRLIVLRRRPRASAWDEHVVGFGETYRTRLLPGFELNLKSRA